MSSTYFFLRLEGLVVLLAALAIYFQLGGNFLLLLLLLFVPDITALGYYFKSKNSDLTYNLGHTYISPSLFFLISLLIESQLGMQIAFIWFAHIGLDRMLGFGLKYKSGFHDTHLGRMRGKA